MMAVSFDELREGSCRSHLATARVMTVSSVNLGWYDTSRPRYHPLVERHSSKYLSSVLFHSYGDPMMSPATAPSMFFYFTLIPARFASDRALIISWARFWRIAEGRLRSLHMSWVFFPSASRKTSGFSPSLLLVPPL